MGETNEAYIDLHMKLAQKIRWFSDEMLAKVSQRLYHGDWSESSIIDVFNWVKREFEELYIAIEAFKVGVELNQRIPDTTLLEIIDECRDVAVTAMMLADLCQEEINLLRRN